MDATLRTFIVTLIVAVVVAPLGACTRTEPETAQPAPPEDGMPAADAPSGIDVATVDAPLTDSPVPGATTTVGHDFVPARRDFGAALLSGVRLPAGFEIDVFATGLGGPRMLEATTDGRVYATRPDSGDVLLLRDRDGDGRAEEVTRAIAGIDNVHGIALDGDRMYLVAINRVYTARMRPDGIAESPRVIIDRLPDAGQHPNRTLKVGPDGMLYVTVGSLSNAVPAPDPFEATLLRARPDGSDLEVVATGLRNTLGFGWHPQTGELWSMDHGIDWLGDEVQREELNRIVEGGDYGWPYCYEDRRPNPTSEPPEGFTSLEAYCAETVPMTLGYTAHAAPMGLAFHAGRGVPAEYGGDAFVAMRGSWNRYPPSGYEVVRIRFDGDGRPASIEPFATDWLVDGGRAHFGRLVGVAVAGDGSLLVGDDTNGVIYRIAYTGAR